MSFTLFLKLIQSKLVFMKSLVVTKEKQLKLPADKSRQTTLDEYFKKRKIILNYKVSQKAEKGSSPTVKSCESSSKRTSVKQHCK